MFNLGVLLAEQGDVEGARAAWQQAIDSGRSGECCLQPNHVPAQLTPAKSPPDRSPSWQRIDLRGGTPSEPPDGPSTLACRCSEADLLLGGRRHPGVAAMTVGHWIHRVVLVRLRNQYVGSLAGPDDRAGVDLLGTVCQSFDPRRPLMAGRFDVRGSIDGVGGTSHRRLR